MTMAYNHMLRVPKAFHGDASLARLGETRRRARELAVFPVTGASRIFYGKALPVLP